MVIWPVAVVIVALGALVIFQSPISDAIKRARGLTYGNKSIDLTGASAQVAVEKQKEAEAPGAIVGKDMVSALHAMPAASEVHEAVEQQIRGSLPPELPRELEKAWLIRWIAIARVQRIHEINYRVIVGSQISLMLLANTPGPPTLAKAREIYDSAKATYPELYATFAFENWYGWPALAGLLRLEQTASGTSVFKITPAGRDFLHYLVENSLTAGKIG
jgi:hypothetical protein